MAITKITTPELFNLQSNNTEGTQLPVMTRAERIAMTGMSNGELIFNSTTDSVEYYDAGAAAWYKIDYVPPILPSPAPTQLDSTISNFTYSANTAGRPNCRITSSTTGYYSTKTSTGFSVGKFYCEMKFLSSSAYTSGRCGPGVGNNSMNLSSYMGTDANSVGLLVRPEMFLYSGLYTGSPGSGSYGTNGIVMMAFDADTRTFFMGYNGSWSVLTGDPITGTGHVLPADISPFYWGGWAFASSDSIEFNFYGSDMAYTIPQGYITA